VNCCACHGICKGVVPTWGMVDAVAATSRSAALKPHKLLL
jgi:hypothetical protein